MKLNDELCFDINDRYIEMSKVCGIFKLKKYEKWLKDIV